MSKRSIYLALAASLGLMGSSVLSDKRNDGRPGATGVKNRRKARRRQKQARRKNR